MNAVTVRRVAGVVVAGGALMAVAACGPLGSSASGDKDGKGGKDVTATASANGGADSPLNGVTHALQALDLVKKAASGVHSAKVESKISVGSTMSMTTKGAMSWGGGLTGDMTIDYTGGTTAETLRNAGMPTTMEVRYLPDAYYADAGDAMAAQTGGKHWIKYSFDDLGKLTGGSGDAMKDMLQNNNPVKSLNAALASPNIAKVGTGTVRGVPATHYRGTLSLGEITGSALANLGSQDQQLLKDAFTKSGITSEAIDLWVSKDNLPVEAAVTANTAAGLMKSDTYYTDFGVPVTAKAPRASDTVDFSELLKSQQSG
jgi:hypothetical protein